MLVVAAWREGTPPRLAARITYTLDARRPERTTLTAAGIDEIGAVVRRWLEHVQASGPAGDAQVTEQ